MSKLGASFDGTSTSAMYQTTANNTFPDECMNLLQNIHLSSTNVKNKGKSKENPSVPINPFLQALTLTGKPNARPRVISQPKQIFRNTSLLGLDSDPNMSSIHNVVEYKDLQMDSPNFKKIATLFPPGLRVLKITQVVNPFLKSSFQLKRHFTYCDVKPLKLFHGTKLKYVHSICTYNFDWRFNGAEKGHKYGKGVNFTLSPKFAMHFCDKDRNEKVVILTDVLVINKGVGNVNLQLPPEGCDTTIREHKSTFVKFCDAEFYPSHVIFFCMA